MGEQARGKPLTCNRCIHYYVTHDAGFRHGCRALDFKSARIPCLDVFEASGEECHYFRKKQPPRK